MDKPIRTCGESARDLELIGAYPPARAAECFELHEFAAKLAAPDCEVWKALRAFVDARAVVELQSAGNATAAAMAVFN